MINKRSMRIRTKKLGVLITDARTVAGKSIEDCAGVLDIPVDRFHQFEQGDRAPSLPELEVLAYFLNIPVPHFWEHKSLASINQDRENPNRLQRLVPLRSRIVRVLLQKSRIDSGLSVSDIAKQTGLSQEQIESYENGMESIPLPDLEILSKSLNLQIEYFFDKKGIIGEWMEQQKAIQAFVDLPADTQDFVTKPVNQPYLEIAKKMSGLSVEQLRGLAEGLLDITL